MLGRRRCSWRASHAVPSTVRAYLLGSIEVDEIKSKARTLQRGAGFFCVSCMLLHIGGNELLKVLGGIRLAL